MNANTLIDVLAPLCAAARLAGDDAVCTEVQVVEARAAVAELVEAAQYARNVIDQLSEKAAGRGDREYCARILKDGNSIDAALTKFGGGA